jgi:hypothetical protein
MKPGVCVQDVITRLSSSDNLDEKNFLYDIIFINH